MSKLVPAAIFATLATLAEVVFVAAPVPAHAQKMDVQAAAVVAPLFTAPRLAALRA